MKNKTYRRINNKKGYVLLLMMIVCLVIIFWRMSSNCNEMISYVRLQKTEMKNSGIKLAPEETASFELGN